MPGANARRTSNGFSLIELLIVLTIMMTIAALALPNFMRARMQANETGAVAAMRSITTGVIGYETSYTLGYPNSLLSLGPPPAGTSPSAAAADLVDALIAAGGRSGYTLAYAAGDTNGDGKNDFYTVHASPVTPGVTGQRYFYVDQTNVIRFNASGPAGPADRPIPQ